MKKIGIIGTGRIGSPVIAALEAGEAGEYQLEAVLNRSGESSGITSPVTDADSFFASEMDLVIEAAGGDALARYGERALAVADVWTVSAAALANADLFSRLETTGSASGRRLRVLCGAIAGLDGLSAIALDPQARVECFVDVMPSENGRKTLFSGTARETAQKFPESTNVVAASALAGAGFDHTTTEVIQPGVGEGRSMGFHAKSLYGELEVKSSPAVIPPKKIHTVAANIISCLRKESQVIWAG